MGIKWLKKYVVFSFFIFSERFLVALTNEDQFVTRYIASRCMETEAKSKNRFTVKQS